MGNSNNEYRTEFQKRAVEMLVHKFIQDYDGVKNTGEELEHFYELWSKNYIREILLRGQVWKAVILRLQTRS